MKVKNIKTNNVEISRETILVLLAVCSLRKSEIKPAFHCVAVGSSVKCRGGTCENGQ